MRSLRVPLLGLALLACAPRCALAQPAPAPNADTFLTVGLGMATSGAGIVLAAGADGNPAGFHLRVAALGGGMFSAEDTYEFAALAHVSQRVGRRVHLRAGAGPSYVRRVEHEQNGWGPLPTRTGQADVTGTVGLALNAAAGVRGLWIFTLEGQAIANLNAVKPFVGVGMGGGFRF